MAAARVELRGRRAWQETIGLSGIGGGSCSRSARLLHLEPDALTTTSSGRWRSGRTTGAARRVRGLVLLVGWIFFVRTTRARSAYSVSCSASRSAATVLWALFHYDFVSSQSTTLLSWIVLVLFARFSRPGCRGRTCARAGRARRRRRGRRSEIVNRVLGRSARRAQSGARALGFDHRQGCRRRVVARGARRARRRAEAVSVPRRERRVGVHGPAAGRRAGATKSSRSSARSRSPRSGCSSGRRAAASR